MSTRTRPAARRSSAPASTRIASPRPRLGDAEQFSFPGWNNETVHGYVVKPAGFEAGKKYPVAFLIHGGPQGSFGNHFHYRWNPQTYAGAGLRRRDDRLPRLDRLRPGLHRRHPRRLGRQAARGPAEGPRRGDREVRVPRRDKVVRARRVLRRLHDQLDRRQLAGPLQVPRHPRRQPRRAHGATTTPRSCGSPSGSTTARRGRTRRATRSTTRSTTWPSGRRRCSSSTAATTTASSTRRAWRRSRRCSAGASRAKFLYFPDENHWVLKPANSILWHETVLGWMDRWLKQPAGGTGSPQ